MSFEWWVLGSAFLEGGEGGGAGVGNKEDGDLEDLYERFGWARQEGGGLSGF